MANLRVDKITSTETFETTGSVQFDGTGDYIDLPNSAAFGSSDLYTIELWTYNPEVVSGSAPFFTFGTGSAGQGFAFDYTSTPALRLDYYSNSITYNVNLQDNLWHHIAATFDGSTRRLFLDGKLVAQDSRTGSYTAQNAVIGRMPWASRVFKGHISNFRILKGKALYTKDFTPPTRELTVTPETVLLCCQHKTDASHEKTGKTITVNGNAVANELTPGLLTDVVKSGGNSAITGSVEFDGTGDYLTVPNTEDLRLADSDFTVEAYINFSNGATSNGVIVALWDNTNNQRSWNLYFDRSANDLYFAGSTSGSSGDNNVSGSIDIEDNNWYHVAACRSGSTIRLFVNGVELASNTSIGTYYDNTTDLVTIGAQNHDNNTFHWKGFISNLRIVKGTALYTDNFIPPTRELKKVPGTVLLCCQDSNDPTQEATGKTITGFGDLDQVYNTQLVPNGDFSDGTNDWTPTSSTLSVSSGQLTITNSGGSNGRATGSAFKTTIGARYILKYDAITTGGSYRAEIRNSGGGGSEQAFQSTTDGATETFEFQATESQHTVVLYSIGADTIATTYDNVSVYKVNPGKTGSDFTPQVGNDGSVEFVGPTKINTENYFYLPTGDTESRETTGSYNAGTRGIFGGGFVGPGITDQRDTIQYINIATLGDAIDAGDLTASRYGNAALASDTRAVWAGGINPTPAFYNIIDAVEIMSTGNAFDFGDLYNSVYYPAGFSNRTRGIYSGGADPNLSSDIGYITISSKGNSSDFGELSSARNSHSTFSSPTRGVICGGYDGGTPGKINTIEYVTISSTGNSRDFGDLTVGRNYGGGCGSAIRGLVGGGSDPSANNTIDYVTISAMGNAVDFGDLTSARQEIGSCSSATRGVFAGAWSPSKVNTIDYVSIQTTGNAQTFGELVNIGVMQEMGTSNGHGGLG